MTLKTNQGSVYRVHLDVGVIYLCSIQLFPACGSMPNCPRVYLSGARINIPIYNTSVDVGQCSSELYSHTASQSNESLAAALHSTSNHLLKLAVLSASYLLGRDLSRASSMLIMYCWNWSEALYEQRIGAKRFYYSGKINLGGFLKSFWPLWLEWPPSVLMTVLFSCCYFFHVLFKPTLVIEHLTVSSCSWRIALDETFLRSISEFSKAHIYKTGFETRLWNVQFQQ